MANDLEIPFDRVTYRDGQLLTARDLRDDQRRDARLRRLHVHHLHETWGIALGFEVQKADAKGAAMVIGPGYAVDAMGHDIVLADGIHLPVPNLAGTETFVLTLAYQEDEAFRSLVDVEGVCLGPDPRSERPVISWRQPDDVRFGPEVPLVQVVVTQGTIQGGLDFRVRRNARPLVRPHMGWGTTEPGRTGWRAWATQDQPDLGLEVEVNTSEAGFIKTPHYFALLHGQFGPAAHDLPPLFQLGVWSGKTEPSFPLGALGFITDTTPERFTYRIIGRQQFPFEKAITPDAAEQRQWTLYWLGSEPVRGCEPNLDLTSVFTLAGFPLLGLVES